MKSFLIVVLFLLFSSCNSLNAQGWLKNYDEENAHYFSKVIETEDNGYLALGPSQNIETNFSEIFLLKTDIDGNKQWSKNYGIPSVHLRSKNLLLTEDGGVLIMGIFAPVQGQSGQVYIIKTDINGVEEWNTQFSYPGSTSNTQNIIQTEDEGYILISTQENDNTWFMKFSSLGDQEWNYTLTENLTGVNSFLAEIQILEDGYLVSSRSKFAKLDLSGEEIWIRTLPELIFKTTSISENNFITISTPGDIYKVSKRDSNGEEIWNTTIEFNDPNIESVSTIDIIETEDSGFILGTTSNFIAPIFHRIGLTKINSLGEEEWNKNVGPDGLYTTSLHKDSFGNIIFSGRNVYDFPNLNAPIDPFIMKTDQEGTLYTSFIMGNVFKDENLDCNFDDGTENTLFNRLVQISGNQTFYGTTDEMGNYNINVDTGTYEVNVILPNLYWDTCDPQTVNITEFFTDTIINLAVQPIIECPWLTVDISTPFLRRCFENNYTVHYCNDGTTTAEDAYIEVNFDQFLEVQSSTLPWTSQIGNTYTFDVGTLDPTDCGNFNITTLVNCDSTVLGQTHCAQAHIFPDSICLPDAANWDGSSIAVEAECDGDSVHFIIRNIGDGNMASPLSYIIIEDEIMVHQDNFQLNSGESQMIPNGFSNGGSTYRIIAEQSEGHPGNSMPTAAIEGCGTTIFPFGFFNMFSQNDGEIFLSIDCQENIGSYDPNDKQAFPTGFGDEHFIWQNIDLEYLIRFQNTGTDTAFTVVIRDTISEHLDITSLQMGASSHNYTYTIDGEGVLKVRFDHILLPDSTTNLLGSNGFFKYKIKQEPDNSIGTMIYNEAAIYFDFNAPIITNETYHEVGEPFFGMTVSTDDLTTNNIKLNVFPNPFGAFTTFEIENLPAGETAFLLYDNVGRLVRKEVVGDDAQFQFYREGLAAGLYFYEFRQAGVSVASGKMVAE